MDLNINLTILLSLLGSFLTLGLYTTGICKYFYNLNEKTIKEWREEHTKQIEKMDAKWERLFERLLIQDQQKKPS